MAGYLERSSRTLRQTGIGGFYWSLNVYDGTTDRAYALNGMSSVGSNDQNYAFPARCVFQTTEQASQSIPSATGVSFTADAFTGQLTGTYTYVADNTFNYPEQSSTYQWYQSSYASGTNPSAISGATSLNYVIPVGMSDKYIAMGVTPRNVLGNKGTEKLSSWKQAWKCGDNLKVVHTYADGTFGPVPSASYAGAYTYETKLVTWNSTNACWILRNLGATQSASGKNDSRKESRGWFWQYNAHQGYVWDEDSQTKEAPAGRTGDNIAVSTDWRSVNDACTNLLGTSWHIPTLTEWQNAFNYCGGTEAGLFQNLLIHRAGYLERNSNTFTSGGGYYWTSTMGGGTSGTALNDMNAFGLNAANYPFPLRCVITP